MEVTKEIIPVPLGGLHELVMTLCRDNVNGQTKGGPIILVSLSMGGSGFRTWNSFKTGKVLGKLLIWFNITRGDPERLCGSECQYRGGTQETLIDSSPPVMFRS